MLTQAVFLDPSSDHFLGDRLFDVDNLALNRDGTLVPYARLREHFSERGIAVHTADKLRDGSQKRDINYYWSFGCLQGYKSLIGDDSVRLRGFVLLEPPLVQPEMYAALPQLTDSFEEVYVHNIVGDGYAIDGIVGERLRKLYWPQPYGDVLPKYWNDVKRKNKLVVIAGNHNPGRREPELYSERIRAIAALSEEDGIDLFGRGWERWWSRQSLWVPYWRYRRQIMSCFKGMCNSKWETLSQYRFSLCFENMPMMGYLTEKIFDCLYAGTVPVYWGASDIDNLVPSGAFVDMRKFNSYNEMYKYIKKMSNEDWQAIREVGREFLRTSGANKYRDSLLQITQL